MKNILLLGAGKSSHVLIKYLFSNAERENWQITVADISLDSAQANVGSHSNGKAIALDVTNAQQREDAVSASDLVISLLPPALHLLAAKDCLKFKKHLVTASYVSPEMNALNDDVLDNHLVFLNECGLDPGIDHMSAMKIIDKVHEAGEKITEFRSYTGGLIAPESNNNPWGYKFTWNPRNVILAGQGTAKYLLDGKIKEVEYKDLFLHTEKINVPPYGTFEGYPNRDSLSYIELYGLEGISTMLRGTLRYEGFCKAWNVFVQLGLTDDSHMIENSGNMTYAALVESLLPASSLEKNIWKRVELRCGEGINSTAMKKAEWSGIFSDETIPLNHASPAQILQNLLEKKWKLEEGDKDMIVMQHHFSSEGQGTGDKRQGKKIISSLVVKGDDAVDTAMAKTVGLPLGIAAKLILSDKIKNRGVMIPVNKEFYAPVLKELEGFGIVFREEEIEY
ncbi:MAG: saccharopine dehydrogenase NADP-binding domain-containing protein [Bacteroidia bacterium]|nr:saccharopine dehydrogenase NADP-binding domain-containing protein [Bacteroidia bacterium]